MDGNAILAIDQGTTNTKAIIVNRDGQIYARASRSPGIRYPRNAWVEQEADELWQTVEVSINECLEIAGNPDLTAIAITNQRETVLAWDRQTGRPLGPAINWQCHRTAEYCHQLKEQGLENFLRERTGLTIDPMFSASKMRWLLDYIENGEVRAKQAELCLGTVDSWILWNLSGGESYCCDYTNASRTQLFNLHDLNWDQEILDIFGVPVQSLPDTRPSCGIYGETTQSGNLPAGIPIACLIGDSHAALYGHAGFQPGAVKATYGTGTSLMTPTREPILSKRGLSTTIAWGKQTTTFALEGNIYITGAVVQWLGQLLGLPSPGEAIEELASKVEDAAGVYLVPAFVGLGAPYWDDSARGLIAGLTRNTTAPHLARAALEAIAFQVKDVFDVMAAEAGTPLNFLLADGGASSNNLLMQFQADLLELPVIRNLSTDVSALGAAYLAGLATGVWGSEEELMELPRPQEEFRPHMSSGQREMKYDGWKQAIRKTLC